jgi:RNA polymerase sigma factor (sigma-70 family)
LPAMTRDWFSGQVVRCQTALFRTARTILKSDQDAEDAVQEAILSAYASLAALREPEKFKPWILRILTNKCYDVCRKSHPSVALSDVEEVIPASGTDCTERLSLWQAVEQLPPDFRTVITLFYYEDLNIRQIGGVLGLSQAAVKTRLHRGRERLKILLGEEGTNDGSV